MNLDTRARGAAQGIRRAVEAMEMSTQTRTPQKIDRLDTYRARQNRARRIGAFAVGTAVLVGAVVIGIRAMDRGLGKRETGSVRTRISEAEAERILDRVIVPFDDVPDGMQFYFGEAGIPALGVLFQDGVAPAWARVGFVDSRLNGFRTPGEEDDLLSLALVYEDRGAAATVLARLEVIFTSPGPRGYGFPKPQPLELGEEGWRYEARSDTADGCRHSLSYLWRTGPVIMVIPSCEPRVGVNDEIAARMEAAAQAALF